MAENEEEIYRLYRLLEDVENKAEVQQVIVGEEVSSEQQVWRSSLDQQDQQDPEPTHIKEEQEELWNSQDGSVPVKSEDDEEKAQSSQLHQRQTVSASAFICSSEDYGGPEPTRKLRVLAKQRLTAAVEQIFGLFERIITEYEEEIDGLHKLLEEAVKPEVQISTADVPQPLEVKEEVPSEQQEWNSSLDQQDREPSHIKEEQEELWSSQDGSVPVKSEDDEAQSSQLHQRQTYEQRMEADGEDCGGSQPTRIFTPASDKQQEMDENTYSDSDHDKENSDDYSQEMSQPQSGLIILNNNEDCKSPKASHPVEKLSGKINGDKNLRADTGGKPFGCSLCGKGFCEKSDLKRHIRLHTGEKLFSCVFCEKNLTEKADLKRHMRAHTREKPFSCTICGKGFSEKTDLTRHIRVHTGEKPFSCSICSKIFSQNKNLCRHERIHTGEKPFSCPVCTKKFTHRGALVVYMRINTGEKPFGCSVCGKRYSETGNLKKHMRVHTGDKAFSCNVCGRRFSCQSQVKNHKCSGESSRTINHHSC